MLSQGNRYIPDFPYEVEVLKQSVFRHEGAARLLERQLLGAVNSLQYWPVEKFSGRSECFRCPVDKEGAIIAAMVESFENAVSYAAKIEVSDLKFNFANKYIKELDPIKNYKKTLEKIRELWPE